MEKGDGMSGGERASRISSQPAVSMVSLDSDARIIQMLEEINDDDMDDNAIKRKEAMYQTPRKKTEKEAASSHKGPPQAQPSSKLHSSLTNDEEVIRTLEEITEEDIRDISIKKKEANYQGGGRRGPDFEKSSIIEKFQDPPSLRLRDDSGLAASSETVDNWTGDIAQDELLGDNARTLQLQMAGVAEPPRRNDSLRDAAPPMLARRPPVNRTTSELMPPPAQPVTKLRARASPGERQPGAYDMGRRGLPFSRRWSSRRRHRRPPVEDTDEEHANSLPSPSLQPIELQQEQEAPGILQSPLPPEPLSVELIEEEEESKRTGRQRLVAVLVVLLVAAAAIGAGLGVGLGSSGTTPTMTPPVLSTGCDLNGLVFQPCRMESVFNLAKVQQEVLCAEPTSRYMQLVRSVTERLSSDWNEGIGSCAPPNLAVWSIAAAHNDTSALGSILLETFALSTLFFATRGHSWANRENWTSNANVCDWAGVGCESGRVVRVVLESNRLNGVIPTELALLSDLGTLNMSTNFGLGSIPSQIGQFSSLEHLLLEKTVLSGSLPTEIGLASRLRTLNVALSSIRGKLPSEIGNLTALVSASFRNNRISGTLPSEIKGCQSLEDFSIAFNDLTGTLPTELGMLGNLTNIDLDCNSFLTTIPTEFGMLGKLEKFSLRDASAIGEMPSELGQMSSLAELRLNNNRLKQGLPSEIGLLTKMTSIDLCDNQFSSTLPTQIGNLKQLLFCHVDMNELTGPIPSELGNIREIISLGIRMNHLTGTMPATIGNLGVMRQFLFSQNRLNGTIPAEVCNLVTRMGAHLEFFGHGPDTACLDAYGGLTCPSTDCCNTCFP